MRCVTNPRPTARRAALRLAARANHGDEAEPRRAHYGSEQLSQAHAGPSCRGARLARPRFTELCAGDETRETGQSGRHGEVCVSAQSRGRAGVRRPDAARVLLAVVLIVLTMLIAMVGNGSKAGPGPASTALAGAAARPSASP